MTGWDGGGGTTPAPTYPETHQNMALEGKEAPASGHGFCKDKREGRMWQGDPRAGRQDELTVSLAPEVHTKVLCLLVRGGH